MTNVIDSTNNQESLSHASTRFAWLSRIWNFFMPDSTSIQEPRIWQEPEHLGQDRWCAYHPITGRSISGVTEAEIRMWLDEIMF